MNNEMPIGEAQNSQETKWYKKWWVILIAVIISLPFFWIVLPVGLIWLLATKGKNWSTKTRVLTGSVLLIFLTILLVNIASEDDKNKQTDKPSAEKTETRTDTQENQQVTEPSKNTPVAETAETPKRQEIKVPEYEIVYEIKGKRYDGGVNYIILIDPIKAQSDSFREDVKSIIKKIVQDKGSKISVDILDDKNTLELYNESHYGNGTLDRILTKQEMDRVGLHLVTSFSGELKTNLYMNTLSFFPGTFTDNPRVGKYVGTIEFNPQQ
jgi:hypothetical protein